MLFLSLWLYWSTIYCFGLDCGQLFWSWLVFIDVSQSLSFIYLYHVFLHSFTSFIAVFPVIFLSLWRSCRWASISICQVSVVVWIINYKISSRWGNVNGTNSHSEYNYSQQTNRDNNNDRDWALFVVILVAPALLRSYSNISSFQWLRKT